jgi:hypothetical protein
MSLYGYSLAQYVVESSLGVPTVVRETAMAEPLGCSVKLRWLNCGVVWIQLRRLEPIRHKRGLLGGCDAHTGGETSVGML